MIVTKKPAPLQRDGHAPTNRKDKQMLAQDTPTDRLVTELEGVCKHVMAQYVQGEWCVTAFVTADHTGPHVRTIAVDNGAVYIESTSPQLSVALDDVLGKVALAAPQQVPA